MLPVKINRTKNTFVYSKFIHHLLLLFIIYLPSPSWAEAFSPSASYSVCFTPGQNCEAKIVEQLDQAQHTILVQAYSFTSLPILSALVVAKDRGVRIRVILDKSQYQKNRYSSATFLDNHGIGVWVDAQPAIAHNKVMVIDDKIVMTGSFNFTKAAQHKNAENLLIIHDPILAKTYIENWTTRQTASLSLAEYAQAKLSGIKHKTRQRSVPWF